MDRLVVDEKEQKAAPSPIDQCPDAGEAGNTKHKYVVGLDKANY
jgi:hypothetical protein